jgi:hypothetical protein
MPSCSAQCIWFSTGPFAFVDKGSLRLKGLTLRKQVPRKNTTAGKGVEYCGNRHLGREAAWRRGLALWKQAPKEGSCLEKGFNIAEKGGEGGKLLGEGV